MNPVAAVPRARRQARVRLPLCQRCAEDAAFLRGKRPAYERGAAPIRLVDLFSGCGGLSIGVAEAARRLGRGTDVRLAVDLDEDAVAVYRANFQDADVRMGSVEELFDGELGRKSKSARERAIAGEIGAVDVLVGGPPCQGNSDLNNHTRRADKRNGLYARMARAAEVLEPTIVLIENVPMVARDVEKVVDVTKDALTRAGYAVGEGIADLSRLGAPQRRRRHVVLATRGRTIDPSAMLASIEPRCAAHPVRSLRWAIEDLATTECDGVFDSASVPSAENVRRIDWLFEKDEYDLPNRLRPSCHRSDHSYISMYGRLAWDEPAQTVTTGFGSMGQGRYVHPSRRRTITPHEAARLQMLPDFWDFNGVRSRTSLARLIGNAVPPPLATALVERVLGALDAISERSSHVNGHAKRG